MQAGLARYAGQTVDALFSYPEPAEAHPLIDAFVGLAVDRQTRPTSWCSSAASTDAQFVNGALTGAAFVASVPLLFNKRSRLHPGAGDHGEARHGGGRSP